MPLIVRQTAAQDTYAATAEAALGAVFAGKGQALAGRSVLIKPNVGRVSVPGTGVCTHPEVVRGAIRAVRAQGAARIVVGDGPIWGVNLREAMQATGIQAVCDAEGVECLDLDACGSLDVDIPGGVVVERLRFSAAIRQVDVIVSVPVLKTHMYTGVSLSIKNMKGCLYKMEKTTLHRLNRPVPDERKGKVLDYGIADMARVLLPDYVLMDGSIGMEGLGPSVGTPRPLGLVLAGDDPLAADFVAARLMGFEPQSVPHLNLIREALRPECDPCAIEVDPPDYATHAVMFEPASLVKLGNEYPHLQVVERGTCSACSAALMVFVRTHGHKLDPATRLVLATGKDLTVQDLAPHNEQGEAQGNGQGGAQGNGQGGAQGNEQGGFFCIGNCAIATAKLLGIPCCPGCPPVGSAILELIQRDDHD